ncbi:MAG: hypothetical protein V7731_09055 [Amphritea sp.]
MNDSSMNLSEQEHGLMELSMSDKRSKLRAIPLLLVSTLVFIGYLSNILLGKMAMQNAMAVPYLSDLSEFLMLFGSVAGFIVFVLLNESSDS